MITEIQSKYSKIDPQFAKLTNMAIAVGHSVIVLVEFLAQAFVFVTKTKDKGVLIRTVCGNV